MEEIRIKIPDELEFIRRMPNIDWSILFGRFIKSKFEKIARIEKIVAKSKLTEEDVREFSDKINNSLTKRYSE